MKVLVALILFWLVGASSSAYADTPEEVAAECAQGRGNIKSCCTLKLDDSDDVQRCIQKATRLRAGKSAQSGTTAAPPASGPAQQSSTSRKETPAPAGETQKPSYKANTKSGPTARVNKPNATYRIGDNFQPHDMSHLPVGVWKPWTVTIHDNSYNQKEYGLKAADIKRFEKKLSDVASFIKELPALNPPRGCVPSLSAYIDGVYDREDSFSKRQPVRGNIMFGCFKLYEAKRKSGKGTNAWEPDHETLHYILYVNGLQELYAGSDIWSNSSSSIRPFDQIFQMPQQVGEHQGFPIYAQNLPNGELRRHYILIARKGIQPFLTVSREMFVKAMQNKTENEIRTSFYGRAEKDLPYSTQTERIEYRRQLEALTPEERNQPACYSEKKADIGLGSQYVKQTVPVGSGKCTQVVRINPELLDPKVSRTAIQFLVISRFGDVQEKYNGASAGNRDAFSHFRLEMDTIIQTDWNRVFNMIDKP